MIAAFGDIDTDRDGLVSFVQFVKWQKQAVPNDPLLGNTSSKVSMFVANDAQVDILATYHVRDTCDMIK